LSICKSFLPFVWSKEPCDTPIVKINNKHMIGARVKLIILRVNKKIKLLNKKNIKE